MNNFQDFYKEYEKEKLAQFDQYCYNCHEYYFHSLKYHTCYEETKGTAHESIYLALYIVYHKFDIKLKNEPNEKVDN